MTKASRYFWLVYSVAFGGIVTVLHWQASLGEAYHRMDWVSSAGIAAASLLCLTLAGAMILELRQQEK